MTRSVLRIIGGSGFYNLPGLDDAHSETVASPRCIWARPT